MRHHGYADETASQDIFKFDGFVDDNKVSLPLFQEGLWVSGMESVGIPFQKQSVTHQLVQGVTFCRIWFLALKAEQRKLINSADVDLQHLKQC